MFLYIKKKNVFIYSQNSDLSFELRVVFTQNRIKLSFVNKYRVN